MSGWARYPRPALYTYMASSYPYGSCMAGTLANSRAALHVSQICLAPEAVVAWNRTRCSKLAPCDRVLALRLIEVATGKFELRAHDPLDELQLLRRRFW